MTCHDAREQLSPLLDDALSAAEREALETHLATCAECRLELERLRGTVALLGRLPPVHAPAGFVDRVMAEATRPPWPRRLLDILFQPLRVKLPLEAAAVLLVSVSALYVYQHAPEVRERARENLAPAPPSPPAPGPPATPLASAVPTEAPPATRPADETAARAPVAPKAPAVASTPEAVAPARQAENEVTAAKPAPPVELRAEAKPDPQPELQAQPEFRLQREPKSQRQVKPERELKPQRELKKEVLADRRPDAPPAAATAEKAAAAEPAPSRDAAGPRAATTPPALAPPVAAPAPVPDARGGHGAGSAGAASPGTPAPESPPSGALSGAKSRTASRFMRASDASGRLVVPAREPAEVALDALLSRVGATRVARRVEGPEGLVLIDVVVPAARYAELLEGLGRLGRWTVEHESKTLPVQVRVEIAVVAAP